MTVSYDDAQYASLMRVVQASVVEIERRCKELYPTSELQRFPGNIKGFFCNFTRNTKTYSFGFCLIDLGDGEAQLNFRFSVGATHAFGNVDCLTMCIDEDANVSRMILNWMQFVENAFNQRNLS